MVIMMLSAQESVRRCQLILEYCFDHRRIQIQMMRYVAGIHSGVMSDVVSRRCLNRANFYIQKESLELVTPIQVATFC
jgi:hypothetical protein